MAEPKIQLSERHKRFADGIMSGLTYGRAYQEAGYTAKNLELASSYGSRLAKKDHILAYIEQKQQEERHQNQLVLARMVRPAIQRLNELVAEGKDEKAIVAACKDIMDRAGYKPKEEVEHSGGIAINIRKEIIDSGAKDKL